MNHTAKRLLSLLLALIFCVSLFPSAALAEEPVGAIHESPAEELPDEPEQSAGADALGGPQTAPAQGEGSLPPAFLLQPASGSVPEGEDYLVTWALEPIPERLELVREDPVGADALGGPFEDEEPALIPVQELDPASTELALTAPEEETVFRLRAFYGEETLLSEPFTVTLEPVGEAVSLPQTGEEDDGRIITAPAEEPEEPAQTEEEPETTTALGATKDDYQFTRQPVGGSVLPDKTITISWETNFSIDRAYIGYYKSSFLEDYVEVKESSGPTNSFTLTYDEVSKAPEGAHWDVVVILGSNSGFLPSDDFSLTAVYAARKFTTQPTSQFDGANTVFIISWETNFTPTKVEIGYKYISSEAFDVKDTITTGLSQSMTRRLPLGKATYTMVVRAYYGDGSYMDSEAFNTGMDKIKFTTQPTSRLSSPNNSFIISWETSFVPTKVEIGYKYISSDNFDVKVTITSGLYQSMTYFLPIDKAMYTMVVRAYYGDGSYQYEDSEVFKPGLNKLGFTKQPSFVYEASEGVFHLSWTTNFTPVKVEIGWANGEIWHPSEEISTGLAQNMSYDFESDIYSALTFYVRAYYKDYSYEDSEGFLLKPDFTKQPTGGTINPEGSRSISWSTNFIPTKVEIGTLINNRWGPRVTLTSDLDGSMSRSLGYDEAADGEMYIRAYYTDTAYAQSAAFTVSKVPRQFTTQPAGGTVYPWSTRTLSWTTNFVPVKVEIGILVDTNRWIARATLTSDLQKNMSRALTYDEAADGEMYVRAFYGTGGSDYVASAVFNMEKLDAYVCGDNLTATLDLSTGRLDIVGSGAMYNYSTRNRPPWFEFRSYIKRAELPVGATYIGTYAFYMCGNMDTLAFPPSVTEIGSDAVYDCSSLYWVTYDGFRSQWDRITWNNGNARIQDGSISFLSRTGTLSGTEISWGIYGDQNLLEIDGWGEIPGHMQMPWNEYGEYVEKVIIWNAGITKIGEENFLGCTAMKTIYLPPSLTWIDDAAFNDCTQLRDVYYDGPLYDWNQITIRPYNDPLLDANLHTTAASHYLTDDVAWSVDDAGLLRIYVTDEFGGSGDQMYIPHFNTSDNKAPWHDDYADLITDVHVESGIGNIGGWAFWDLTKLQTVELAGGVTGIGQYAFSGCSALTDIQLPDSITGIAASAFRNCTSLTQIRLPSKAKIWQNTFYGCSKLEKVWLPENAESIPEGYFYNCQKLKEIHIPGTVTGIGKNAFFACNALKTGDVYFNGTSAQWAAITVDTTGNTTLLNAGNIHFSPEELRVDAVNFPDESFCAYVANYFDTDGSGWLNADEIAAADYINDEDNDYTTLQGIEFFPNLTGILIDAAPSLTSVDLSANTELNNVDFSGCGNLAEINVSGLNKLHALNVADNALTDLDLRGLTTLQYLAVDENPITELDLGGLTLTELFCRNTSLSSLDLNGQTALFRLYCYGAGIKELDLTGCPLLCEILRDGTRTLKTSDGVPYVEYRLGSTNHVLAIDRDCVCYTENSGIRIDAVNFPDPVFRQYVSLTFDADRSGYLSYEEIEAATAICMEEDYDVHSLQGIGYFTELTSLLVDSNPNLTSLDLTANTRLSHVEVWGNGLTELKLEGLEELKVLDCSDNTLTELDVTGLPLTELYCSRNPLSLLILGEQPELKTLECYGTAGKLILIDIRPCPYLLDAVLEGDFSEPDRGDLYEGPLGGKLFADAGTEILIPGSVSIDVTNFPDETFREFVARYDVNHTQWLVPKELLAVDQIDCSGLPALESLQGVQYFTELVTLICSSCSISTLDLHANTMLEYLEAENMAALTSLNVSGLTGLNYIAICDCSLTELDVSGCELSYLECDHNPLTSLILGRQEALESLVCYAVELAELDLSDCPILLDAWLNGTHTECSWGLEVNGSEGLGGYMELDKDQTVVTGIPETCTVSFDANGHGTAPEAQTVVEGECAAEPEAPTAEGWLFGGWYLDPDCTEPYAFTTPVTADLTLYAKWTQAYIPGDINGDGKLNNKDVTRLQKYLKGEDVEVNAAALDVNGDGKVNNKDITRLQKYLKGEDVEIH